MRGSFGERPAMSVALAEHLLARAALKEGWPWIPQSPFVGREGDLKMTEI